MKLLLHYRTDIGPRTIIAEVADTATANAVRAAHQAMGEDCALVGEMPRLSLSAHITRQKKRQAKSVLRAILAAPNVTPMRKAAGKKA